MYEEGRRASRAAVGLETKKRTTGAPCSNGFLETARRVAKERYGVKEYFP